MSTFVANFRTSTPIEPDEREWALFFIFGLVDRYQAEGDWAAFVEWWDDNVDWFSRLFASPDAWLSPEGDSLREALGGKNPSIALPLRMRPTRSTRSTVCWASSSPTSSPRRPVRNVQEMPELLGRNRFGQNVTAAEVPHFMRGCYNT